MKTTSICKSKSLNLMRVFKRIREKITQRTNKGLSIPNTKAASSLDMYCLKPPALLFLEITFSLKIIISTGLTQTKIPEFIELFLDKNF